MQKILYSLNSIGALLKAEKPSLLCVVTSKKLATKLAWATKKIGVEKKNIVLLPDGEGAKKWRQVEKVLRKFIELGLDRQSIVIALGGGSIGDVTGFAAAIYLRGITYIQIPTTLLAQVDSAHGGKTGINFLQYKNQVGSFHLPLAIIIEPRFLKTLSEEQVVDGLGEIIKAGVIKDPSILSILKKEKLSSLLQSPKLVTIIKKAIRVKEYYTKNDYKDTGIRQILNFGHTIGHAVELKYKMSHGRAVLIGMLQELELGEAFGITPPRIKQNLLSLLRSMEITILKNFTPNQRALLRDKKIAGRKIYLPVIVKEGKSKLIKLNTNGLRKVA